MRTRQIHPRFWISESVAAVGFFERLLFQALWGLADREGLLLYRPGEIRPQAFPHDASVTKEVLIKGIEALAKAELVRIIDRTDKTDDPAIFIPKFKEYQWINKDEAKSKLIHLYFIWNPDESIWVHTDPRQSYSYTLTFNDSNVQTIKNPPTPRKRGVPSVEVAVIVEHLNKTTGKRFAADRATTEIERCLKAGATASECIEVIDHLWSKWGGNPKMVDHLNKVTPFRKSHFDAYLDEARAGRVTAAAAPPAEPIPREVIADLEFEVADGADIEAWLSKQRPAWVPMLREKASRMAGAGR